MYCVLLYKTQYIKTGEVVQILAKFPLFVLCGFSGDGMVLDRDRGDPTNTHSVTNDLKWTKGQFPCRLLIHWILENSRLEEFECT